MNCILSHIHRAAEMLAKPALLFFALPWLMALLVLGTVAQRYIGLYQSQRIFFGSFVLWAGMVPLPGAYAVLLLLAAGLVCKLALKSPLRRYSAGVVITHVSALLLLAGGVVTACTREEGYMVLKPGETGATVSDYHVRELSVLKNGIAIKNVLYDDFRRGLAIASPDVPFSITLQDYCYHCKAVAVGVVRNPRGLAAKLSLAADAPQTEDAANLSGVVFSVSGAGAEADGSYVAGQMLEEQPAFTIGHDHYLIVMRQQQREIPFRLRLIRFDKSEYPGTAVARSYRSEVEVSDDPLKWEAVIEMNQPLRYRGYTVYQSSFVENEGGTATVLAVVKNTGELFPYIAVTALCIGLLLHLTTVLRRKKA